MWLRIDVMPHRCSCMGQVIQLASPRILVDRPHRRSGRGTASYHRAVDSSSDPVVNADIGTSPFLDDLVARARAVLDAAWIGASSLPSRTLYPHQWSWDSAFIALGRSWYDQPRAQQELETLFRAQWSNGMVP